MAVKGTTYFILKNKFLIKTRCSIWILRHGNKSKVKKRSLPIIQVSLNNFITGPKREVEVEV